MLGEFYRNGKIAACTNYELYFITLVAKKNRLIKIKDFHLTSSITSVYKIITKVLTSRLSEILSNTIPENKCAYIHSKQILDAALIANIVVNDVRTQKKQGLVFNLDYEKAYYHVSG